jgi:hypothetical protein
LPSKESDDTVIVTVFADLPSDDGAGVTTLFGVLYGRAGLNQLTVLGARDVIDEHEVQAAQNLARQGK